MFSLVIYFIVSISSVQCLVAQLCLTLCDPMDCSPPGSSVHGDSPGKNTGVGCHALLQGIFPTQQSNPDLPHCRQIPYRLSHQGSPRILECVACRFSTGTSPGIELGSPALLADSYQLSHPGKTINSIYAFLKWVVSQVKQ